MLNEIFHRLYYFTTNFPPESHQLTEQERLMGRKASQLYYTGDPKCVSLKLVTVYKH